MAKADISHKGIDHLNKLKADLLSFNREIESSGITLRNVVNGLSDELGTYETDILDLIEEINQVQESGRETIEELSKKIDKLILGIESLLTL